MSLKNGKKRAFFYLVIALNSLFLISCSNTKNVIQGYIEGEYTYITAPISGTLDQLLIKKGEYIKKGKILFILDEKPEIDEWSAAQQKLTQAKQTLEDMSKGSRPTVIETIQAQKAQISASLNFNKKTLLRYRSLQKQGAIDKASVDQAEAAYESDLKKIKEIEAQLLEAKLGARENALLAQKALVKAAQADLKRASWALEEKVQRAPIDALVFDTLFTVGERVLAGHPVVTLLASKNVKVIFFIPEKWLSKITLGEKISFRCSSCPQLYLATVSFISNNAEYTPPVIYSEKSREKLVYRIEASLDPKTAILVHPGQPVELLWPNTN